MKDDVADLVERIEKIFDLRPVINNFGLILKTIRIGKGLTQKDLADEISKKIGLQFTRVMLSNVETGKRELTAAEYLGFCQATNARFAELMSTNQLLTKLEEHS